MTAKKKLKRTASVNFLDQLADHYRNEASVLCAKAKSAASLVHKSDIGSERESIYIDFLSRHIPSKCLARKGGILFDEFGTVSKQLDILISTDTSPRFSFGNGQKSFAPVEGSLEVIVAYDGTEAKPLLEGLKSFYTSNPDIPICRRPNIIHVIGKALLIRKTEGMVMIDNKGMAAEFPIGQFSYITREFDIHAMFQIVDVLQRRASEAQMIFFSYAEILKNLQKRTGVLG